MKKNKKKRKKIVAITFLVAYHLLFDILSPLYPEIHVRKVFSSKSPQIIAPKNGNVYSKSMEMNHRKRVEYILSFWFRTQNIVHPSRAHHMAQN